MPQHYRRSAPSTCSTRRGLSLPVNSVCFGRYRFSSLSCSLLSTYGSSRSRED
jgi:hypothetical protein